MFVELLMALEVIEAKSVYFINSTRALGTALGGKNVNSEKMKGKIKLTKLCTSSLCKFFETLRFYIFRKILKYFKTRTLMPEIHLDMRAACH